MKAKINIILVCVDLKESRYEIILTNILKSFYMNGMKVIYSLQNDQLNSLSKESELNGDLKEIKLIEISSKTVGEIDTSKLLHHHFYSLAHNMLSQILPHFKYKEGIIVWKGRKEDIKLLAIYLKILSKDNKNYDIRVSPLSFMINNTKNSNIDLRDQLEKEDINYLPEIFAEIYKQINVNEVMFRESQGHFLSNETIAIYDFDLKKREIILEANGIIMSIKQNKQIASVYVPYDLITEKQRKELGLKEKILNLKPQEKVLIENMPGIILRETKQPNEFIVIGVEQAFQFIEKNIKKQNEIKVLCEGSILQSLTFIYLADKSKDLKQSHSR